MNAGEGANTITGTSGDNEIYAGAGADTITVTSGNNTIQAGAGANTITATTGNNTIMTTGAGANTITATTGNNTITTGAGADTITLTSGDNTIDAGDGANTITATSGNNTITSGAGVDTVTVTSGNNTIDVGDGANTVTAAWGNNVILGGDGIDTVTTGDGNNIIRVGNGANTVTTGAGVDQVYTGVDIDTITSGAGDDEIHILGGTDTITAGAGTDTLFVDFSAAAGAVTMSALAGTASAGYAGNISGIGVATFAGVENFDITSGSFNDVITTGGGTDVVHAGGGSDTVNLAGGNDEAIYTMAANAGAIDVYQGGAGVDTLTLEFTEAEWLSSGVQTDIANYLQFISDHTDSLSSEADSAVFQFTAFNLSASEFEALNVIVDGVELDPSDYAPSNYVFALDDIGPGAWAVDAGNAEYVNSPALNTDATKLVFSSDSTDLVANDTNSSRDVFVRDLATGDVTLVSATSSGDQLISGAYDGQMSGNGNAVAFVSNDSTAVPNDTNNTDDVFVKNLDTGVLQRASESATGDAGNSWSQGPSISDDGTKVGFYSRANNLVANDTNVRADFFVKDMTTGDIVRASTSSTGVQGNRDSYLGVVSGDGKFAAFHSDATNFDPNDTNGTRDIYVKNLTTGELAAASTNANGDFGNSYTQMGDISADGRYVLMDSAATNLVANDTNGQRDLFVKDMLTGTMTMVTTDGLGTQANGSSNSGSISDDGRYVAFISNATNLSLDPQANYGLVYVKDLHTGTLTQVSIDVPTNFYVSEAKISGDGTTVTYSQYDYSASGAKVIVADIASVISNAGKAYKFDQVAIDVTAPGAGQDIQIDWGNGETSDVSGTAAGDVYRLRGEYDTGVTTVASVTVMDGATVVSEELINVQTAERDVPLAKISTDENGNTPYYTYSYEPSVSGDGNLIAFSYQDYYGYGQLDPSAWTYDSMIYVKDRQTGEAEIVSRDASGVIANSSSYGSSISADGTSVGFYSYADNLVLGDTNNQDDVFVKNLDTGAIELVSKATDGTLGNSTSYSVTLSADGTKAAFTSYSSNLTANDTNGNSDVFVHDLTTGITELVSVNLSGVSSTGYVNYSQISDDGTHVAFSSSASDLVAGDLEGQSDVFVRDLTTGITTRVSEVVVPLTLIFPSPSITHTEISFRETSSPT